MSAKQRAKPYSPSAINGCYVHNGNVVVKLDKRHNARSITFTPDDIALLQAIVQRKPANQ